MASAHSRDTEPWGTLEPAGAGKHSGGGDPMRSIELLWGGEAPRDSDRRTRRGPKPKLTVAQITRTAIEIADTQGLSALSIRRIADELGVAPMSLYTYVPGKAELIDLMLDAALGEALPRAGGGDAAAGSGGWRARLEGIARENWALHRRHPWMLHVVTHRPALGPNLIAKYDAELRAVDRIGLTDLEMDSVISLISGYVQGAARASVEARQVEQRTGMTDAQWWESHAPVLERVLDPERFPLAARVGSAAGDAYQAVSAPEHNFEFGLRRILDGIAVLVGQREEDPPR